MTTYRSWDAPPPPPDTRSRATALLQGVRLTSLSIALIAEALGTTTEYLVTGKEPRRIGTGLRIPAQDPDRPEACRAILKLAHTTAVCERPFNHDDIHEAELEEHSYLRWSYAGRRVLPLTGEAPSAATGRAAKLEAALAAVREFADNAANFHHHGDERLTLCAQAIGGKLRQILDSTP